MIGKGLRKSNILLDGQNLSSVEIKQELSSTSSSKDIEFCPFENTIMDNKNHYDTVYKKFN